MNRLSSILVIKLPVNIISVGSAFDYSQLGQYHCYSDVSLFASKG